jgi:hypothetical protein
MALQMGRDSIICTEIARQYGDVPKNHEGSADTKHTKNLKTVVHFVIDGEAELRGYRSRTS